MTKPRLTIETVNELELQYRYSSAEKIITDPKTNDQWEFIFESSGEYDEGGMIYQFVYRHVETGELWAFDYYFNSWSEYYEVYDPYLVRGVEKTITVYEKA